MIGACMNHCFVLVSESSADAVAPLWCHGRGDLAKATAHEAATQHSLPAWHAPHLVLEAPRLPPEAEGLAL